MDPAWGWGAVAVPGVPFLPAVICGNTRHELDAGALKH